MKYFVDEDSIVREIWGKSDTVLFIFAGAAAEFALNKAVDWLFFTGRIPSDPLGRMFSTVDYARRIIFLPYEETVAAIDSINAIHNNVEKMRGDNIPQWSYRDVLYMLIGYSINAFELLERKLTEVEKQEVFDVFYRVGQQMNIENLPQTYFEWLTDREKHMQQDLERSKYTDELYQQYKKHLGPFRYWLLLRVQSLVCPPIVGRLLNLKSNPVISPDLLAYKLTRTLKINNILKYIFLPSGYKQQIRELDRY